MPRTPAGRSGGIVAVVALVAAGLVAGVGVGYGVSRPLLGDGSAFLAKGHTITHVNGETGRSDAEVAQQLATGSEGLQTVRLPDGRVAVVNKATGTVTIIDAATLVATGPAMTHDSAQPQLEALATTDDGYLVDAGDDTVQRIAVPGQAPAAPVKVNDGIATAVPSGASVWVLTERGEVVEVHGDRTTRTVRLGDPAIGLTVADGHPVAVTAAGRAFVVDGTTARGIGELGVTGADLIVGSHRGAGRHVLGVDRRTGRFAALDPRTGQRVVVSLAITAGRADLRAPVELGSFAYVPDYSGPSLWRVDLSSSTVEGKPLEVPGQPGVFSLEVSGDRLWANSQYDRRVLVVDVNGHERYVDKGAGPDVGDTQGQTGGGTAEPPPSSNPPPVSGANPAPPSIPVPAFPAGTKKDQACAALAQLSLHCRTATVGEDNGRPTNEVVDTDPPAGTLVPANAEVLVSYVGPLRTPDVLGQDQQQACQQLSVRFSCTAEADHTPVTSPAELGRVSAQDPQPDTPLERGGQITLTYPDSIALPPVAGQTQGEACARLTGYGMTCEPVEGDPGVGAGKTPGTVYLQQPAAGTVAPIGTAVRVTFYRGTAPVGSYVGATNTDACAAVQAAGFTCVPVEGRTAAGTGQQPGYVYDQSPAAGTTLNLGQPVQVTFLSGSNDLPDYRGAAADAACGDINARGFQCNAVAQPYPSTNRVEVQDQGAGRYPIGSVVTIHYAPWGLVQYTMYQHNSLDVWVLRPTGSVPAGYGRASYVVGTAYLPGTLGGFGREIWGFTCTAGNGKCNGLDVNHFYTNATSYGDANFAGPSAAANFINCAYGGRQIWRVWTAGSPRLYRVVDNPAGWAGNELLGCVW